MILKSASGKEYDLLACPGFKSYLDDPANYVELIVKQINDNLYGRYLPPGNDLTILDLGANIGLTTLYFKDVARRIYSVEPTPQHFKLLANMVRTFGETNVNLFELAVGNKKEVRTFNTSKSNGTNNSFVKWGSHDGQIAVQCTTLRDLFSANHIGEVDFCKMDIEGAEAEVIDQVVSVPIKSIFVECHNITVAGENISCFDLVKDTLATNFDLIEVDGSTIFGVRK
jgi:FkbM family methyltransferase